jgi:serine/threonine protein kinase
MITSENWARVRSLFQETLDRPAAEREAYLRLVPGVDDQVRREVESLLEANALAEGFLDVPAIESLSGRPVSSATALTPGLRLGAFEILGPLGAGGMGEVHRARDTRLGRTVAIKVLTPQLPDNPRNRERFEREARLVSKLNHPGICTLHDVGSTLVDGRPVRFLVMELLDGETLAGRLRRGPLPLDEALRVGRDIVEALGAIHALGIVHRDLKPANIMLTRSGVKLLDFGLARLRTGSDAVSEDPLTQDGLVAGTVPYMAPEQLRGEEADARADLFAFGAVLHEMLTGRRAFAAESQAELIAAILDHDPPALTTRPPHAPAALAALVAACLAKDPNDRWQHARDVALALGGIIRARAAGDAPPDTPSNPPATAGRSRRVHTAWALVALAAGLLGWWLSPATPAALPPANPRPVIVLMDSPLPGRVYDPRTLAAGGTNADDVSDALRDLPIVTYKENTSAMWHREEQVRAENPDLIISHLSCLLDERVAKADEGIADHLFDMAQKRLTLFFGYLAAVNPRTRFLVYSRGRFDDDERAGAWLGDVLARFPRLKGRLFVMLVPGGTSATFRDPATANLLRTKVSEILGRR